MIKDIIETIKLMCSDDYRDRFKAEYYQTKIRRDKLHHMLVKYSANTLEFEPDTPVEMLAIQEEEMNSYLETLEIRAEIEGIELDA